MEQEYKIVDLAPYIYNVKNFIYREHPTLHPQTTSYLRYWELHEKRSVDGYWGLDQAGTTKKDKYDSRKPGGWRFMTPQHYWYTQCMFIQDDEEEEGGSSGAGTKQPDVRDIDWYLFYSWLTCVGFSGFEKEKKYSCLTILKKLTSNKEKEQRLSPKEKLLLKKLHKRGQLYQVDPVYCTITGDLMTEGVYREYIDPIVYLRKTFTEPLGLPLYLNPRTNLFFLATRGIGKSYFMSALISQAYNFMGKLYYKDYMKAFRKREKGPVICVGSILSGKSGELLSKFSYSQDMLAENFGHYEHGDGFKPGFFHKEYAGGLDVGNEKKMYRHQYKIKKNGVWITRGSRTGIMHGSYENNPEVFVGQRAVLMAEDEVGLNYHLLKSSKADETVMIMRNKMGSAIKCGTGGNIEKITENKVIFYDPVPYGYLGFKNGWEDSVGDIGLFVPAYYTDSSFRDENGNQNKKAALEQELTERAKKAKADSTAALDGYITARPLKPSEIFLNPETNVFPTGLLREIRADLVNKKVFQKTAMVGNLSYIDKEQTRVKFDLNYDKYSPPILTYDLKPYEGHLRGSVVLFEDKVDNIPNPKRKNSLYKIGYDPVRDDGTGSSLNAIIVYKGISDGDWNLGIRENIVAEYYGRRDLVSEIHEIAIKLALYYNAKIMLENDIPDFIRYCRRKNKLRLLAYKPHEAISKVVKHSTTKYEYGISMKSPALHIHAEQLINQWLLTEVGPDPANPSKILLNAHNIKSLRLLDEFLNYDRKKNTDGISAMKMIALWNAQENILPVKERTVEKERKRIDKYLDRLNGRTDTGEVPYYKSYNSYSKNLLHEF